MSFVQAEFLVFFLVVYTLYWAIPKQRWQNLLLSVAGAIFYGWIHPWFLILLYSSAVLDFLSGLGQTRWPHRKKIFLAMSLCGNLGMLGYFKYFDFFVASVKTALDTLGVQTSLHTLGIFLPVGISFYTFQTMSYTIDVYRGKVKARRNVLDYLTFVSFFPQLVAGPVERATNLLLQVEKPRRFVFDRMASGLSLALWGVAKKMVVADTIAPYVDRIFTMRDPSGPMIWAATLGFTIQILADFSGYTDIARGVARMLGFELLLNFDHPYMARSPSDFWRRWHISFSSWIRDYVYIPVGGSRGSSWCVTRNTFIAMVTSGIWHGASWNFALWGAYHAALLTAYRFVSRRIPRRIREQKGWDVVLVPLMFAFTWVGWLVFRETDVGRLLHWFTLNPMVATPDQWVATTMMLAMCGVCGAILVGAMLIQQYVVPRMEGRIWLLPLQTAGWALCVIGMFVFTRLTVTDFIYFQF